MLHRRTYSFQRYYHQLLWHCAPRTPLQKEGGRRGTVRFSWWKYSNSSVGRACFVYWKQPTLRNVTFFSLKRSDWEEQIFVRWWCSIFHDTVYIFARWQSSQCCFGNNTLTVFAVFNAQQRAQQLTNIHCWECVAIEYMYSAESVCVCCDWIVPASIV